MTAPVLVVVASSARMLAEAARREGLQPFALDLFGDLDTRRVAHWIGIGSADGTGIDAKRMHSALARLAKRRGVLGWVAGGGFEDRLHVLEECAHVLPLLGNDVCTIAAVKDPGRFFPMLEQHGIPHPETRVTRPSSPAGWLSKAVGGTGGWHVRRVARMASAQAARPSAGKLARRNACSPALYYQREASGVPMSALFLANAEDVLLIGFNRLLVAARGVRPFVFQGAVGPVALTPQAEAEVTRAAREITRHAGLVGLNSLDFLLDGSRVSVIEVNPRPSATIGLYPDWNSGGLMKAHLDACLQRSMPRVALRQTSPVRGFQILYAHQRLLAGAPSRLLLQATAWCHDIGPAGTWSGRGEPLCTVSAYAGSADEVIARLARRARDAQRIHEQENGIQENGI